MGMHRARDFVHLTSPQRLSGPTQLLLRSAVACLAAAEPFCGLATLLPTEGLGLAPCALAGILLAAAEQVSRTLASPGCSILKPKLLSLAASRQQQHTSRPM